MVLKPYAAFGVGRGFLYYFLIPLLHCIHIGPTNFHTTVRFSFPINFYLQQFSLLFLTLRRALHGVDLFPSVSCRLKRPCPDFVFPLENLLHINRMKDAAIYICLCYSFRTIAFNFFLVFSLFLCAVHTYNISSLSIHQQATSRQMFNLNVFVNTTKKIIISTISAVQ